MIRVCLSRHSSSQATRLMEKLLMHQLQLKRSILLKDGRVKWLTLISMRYRAQLSLISYRLSSAIQKRLSYINLRRVVRVSSGLIDSIWSCLLVSLLSKAMKFFKSLFSL